MQYTKKAWPLKTEFVEFMEFKKKKCLKRDILTIEKSLGD